RCARSRRGPSPRARDGGGRVRRIDPLAVAALVLFVVLGALAVASSGVGGGSVSPAFGRSGSIYDESSGGASVLRRYLEGVGVTVVPVQGDRKSTRLNSSHT